MKRVLLTGAGGFVGHHTLEHLLLNTDWEIVCTDSFRHRGKTDRLRQVLQSSPEWNLRVKVLTHDLCVPISDQFAWEIGDIDYVISMASESHVDRSIEEPRDFIENNVALVLSLLEYVRKHPVEKIVHVSTDEVYGPAFADPHPEGSVHLPSNPYSASKSCQESICRSYWRTYDLPICITNTMNIIGERQDPEKFIPSTIRKILHGETVTCHGSKEGTPGSRFYLHARNQADALLYLLQNVEFPRYSQGLEMEQFNVVGEREVDNVEMAEMIAHFMGKPISWELVDFHSSRPGHDLRYALDGRKLALCNWSAPVSLELSLERTVSWTLEHAEWLL